MTSLNLDQQVDAKTAKKTEKSLRQMKTKDVAVMVTEEFKIAVDIALERFRLSDGDKELSFPSSLTPVERAYIHHLCQPLGLKSKSKGKDPNRVLTVTRKKKKDKAASASSFTFEKTSRVSISTLSQKYPVTVKERQELQPRTERAQLYGVDVANTRSSKHGIGRINQTVAQVPPPRRRCLYEDFTSALPISQLREEIVTAINTNTIIMITGETGSGKTTQVPQMILDDCCQKNRPCRILCSQPRRLAAMSVADRVAAERGEELGQTVGYTIRLESRQSPKTLLMFCTTGVLLRTLTGNERSLDDVTHVIVDEIHERDRFSDFLLMVLRDHLSRRRTLKLILMSAAINTQLFLQYFSGCSLISAPGRLFDVKEYYLEDILEQIKYRSKAMIKYENSKLKIKKSDPEKLSQWCEEVSQHSRGQAASSQAMPSERVREDGEEEGEEEKDDEDHDESVIIEEKVGEEKEQLDEKVTQQMDSLLEKIFLQGDESLFSQVFHLMATENVSVDYEHSQTFATALMLAAGRGFVAQVEQLIMLGANISHHSASNGWAAINWAEYFQHFEVVELLKSYLAVTETCPDSSPSDVLPPQPSTALTDEQQQLLLTYQATIDEEKVDVQLLNELLYYIHSQLGPGAILVFLPGYDDITSARDQILEDERFAGNKFLLYLLHSSLQSSDQRKVFNKPPAGTRKIVLSTNLAETSITINDVICVVDAGKVKEKTFDALTSVHTLKGQWISKASALQRKGRAGRCQDGICYRLFSRRRFESFQQFQTPEILRHPLHELCLQTKLVAPPNTAIADFLVKAPDPPSFLVIRNAVHLLKQIDALDTFEDLTDLGRHLSNLPIEPRYGKMILYAVVLRCLDPILTIAAAMSHKDPFVLPMMPYMKRQAVLARHEFSQGTFSDHMSLLGAFQAWQQACAEHREYEFCVENFISKSSMEMIWGIRGQLLKQLRVSGFVRRRGSGDLTDLNFNSDNWAVVKAALTAGLYPCIVQADRVKAKLMSHKENKLHFHMTSVLSSPPNKVTYNQARKAVVAALPTDWLVYEEMSRSHHVALIKGCTVVSPITVALFAGPARLPYETWGDEEERRKLMKQSSDQSGGVDSESEDDHDPDPDHDPNMSKLSLDDWLSFVVDKQTAHLAKTLRQKCQAMILHRIQRPHKSWNQNDEHVIQTIVNVLTEEEKACGLPQPAGIGAKQLRALFEEFASDSGSHGGSRDESSDEAVTKQGTKGLKTNAEEEEVDQLTAHMTLSASSSASSSPTDEDRPSETGLRYPNRYFVMKCQNYKCLDMSIQRKQWSTHPLNEKKLTVALQEGSSVYLVFSVQGSSHFQGVAKMAGRPGAEKIKEFGTGHAFPVTWLKRANLPFNQCHHLINSWNDNKRVQVSRDGQELEPTVGEMLVQLWEKIAPLQYQSHPSRAAVPPPEYWSTQYAPSPGPPPVMYGYGQPYTMSQQRPVVYGQTYSNQGHYQGPAGQYQGPGGQVMRGYYPHQPRGAYGPPRHQFYR